MAGFNFTDKVRRALALARSEAARLQQSEVDTQHLLLGIILEGEGMGVAVLRHLGVDGGRLLARIEETSPAGAAPSDDQSMPYTAMARRVLEGAMASARDLNHGYVGTEHMLLGLLSVEEGLASQLLAESGVTRVRARIETVALLGRLPPGYARPSDDEEPALRRRMPRSAAEGAPHPAELPDASLAQARLQRYLAEARLAELQAERVEEERAWMTVRELVQLHGGHERPPTVHTSRPGALEVRIGDDLVVTVPVGPCLRIEPPA